MSKRTQILLVCLSVILKATPWYNEEGVEKTLDRKECTIHISDQTWYSHWLLWKEKRTRSAFGLFICKKSYIIFTHLTEGWDRGILPLNLKSDLSNSSDGDDFFGVRLSALDGSILIRLVGRGNFESVSHDVSIFATFTSLIPNHPIVCWVKNGWLSLSMIKPIVRWSTKGAFRKYKTNATHVKWDETFHTI